MSFATAQNKLLAVNSTSPAAGDPVIVSDAGPDGPAPNQIWQLVPANIFNALLQKPPQDYPALTGDQIAGYQCINDYLGIPDGITIRGEYPNPNTPLGTWSGQLADMPPPPPSVISPEDFDA